MCGVVSCVFVMCVEWCLLLFVVRFLFLSVACCYHVLFVVGCCLCLLLFVDGSLFLLFECVGFPFGEDCCLVARFCYVVLFGVRCCFLLFVVVWCCLLLVVVVVCC